MKLYTPLQLILLFCMLTGCTKDQRGDNPESWTEDQASEWFAEKAWLGKTSLQPDASIDKKEFAVRYHQNKARWDKAFAFLKSDDLSAHEAGTFEIDGRDVYATISEYNSKNHEDARYESHQKYTDLQYVVSGTEYIGLTDLSGSTVKTPYNEEKDIAFYDQEKGLNLIARPGTFFIFFPGNVHRPGMKVEENIPVKKIVIKVRN